MRGYDAYQSAVGDRELPLAYLDRNALDANIRTTQQRASNLPVRIASKSIRCPDVLEYVLDHDGFEGVMCYTGHEAAYLASRGFDDLLVAYPVVHPAEIERVRDCLSEGVDITLMIDSETHVERIGAVAREGETEVPVCIDVDMSTEHLGIHFGVRRSGIQTPEDALSLARTVASTEGVSLHGVMGYESQIAGIPDDDPSKHAVANGLMRRLKDRSAPEMRRRREVVVAALEREGYDLEFVNGGGTGSVEVTRRDTSVTELTVGSGFYAPSLFDYYRSFEYEPAAGYAIEVVRRPSSDIYTCRGGGFVASGSPGEDKTPTVHLPDGASLTDNEGAGEVQTPVEYEGPVELDLGDPVFLRHAKAGELCTNVTHLHVIDGEEIVDRYPTYRGDGGCFL